MVMIPSRTAEEEESSVSERGERRDPQDAPESL